MSADQTTLEGRRKANIIIKELRKHQEQLENDREHAIDANSEILTEHFRKAEGNLKKTQTVDQALIDAQIFHRMSQFSKKQAEQLQTGLRTYDVKSFTDHLIEHIQRECNIRNARRSTTSLEPVQDDDGDVSLDFQKFGQSIWNKFRSAHPLDCMLGREVNSETPVNERKARAVKKPTKLVKPTELKTEDVDQTETDRQVMLMRRELKNRHQVNFWLFVIDPNDFAHSVENVFHSSFLIKDQWAELDMKKEPPMLRYRDRDAAGPARPQGAHTHTHSGSGQDHIPMSQFILGFDKVLWKEVIERYTITQCMLPRPSKTEGEEPAPLGSVVQEDEANF